MMKERINDGGLPNIVEGGRQLLWFVHHKKQLFPNEERAVFVVVKDIVSLIVLVNE